MIAPSRVAQIRESRDPDAAGVDWAGLVTFSLGLFLLVFALVRGNDSPFGPSSPSSNPA